MKLQKCNIIKEFDLNKLENMETSIQYQLSMNIEQLLYGLEIDNITISLNKVNENKLIMNIEYIPDTYMNKKILSGIVEEN